MTDMRKTIRCSNCGNEASIYINSELEMSELLLAGRCARCGNSMQVTYSIVEKTMEAPRQESREMPESSDTVNLDESLFGADPPSDTLKDIMEE